MRTISERAKEFKLPKEKAQASGVRRVTIMLVLFGVIGAVAAVHIVSALNNYSGARREYETLRQYAPVLTSMSELPPTMRDTTLLPPDVGTAAPVVRPESVPAATSEPYTASELSAVSTDTATVLSAVNPDYAGWIRIEGTEIDYPVVRGADNEKYLHTTFSGEENPAGAIFMDSRGADGLGGAAAILYGHNMRDGSMFASLHGYLDSAYLVDHRVITVITASGETLSYSVFAARQTDITDRAYALFGGDSGEAETYLAEQGAPAGAERFLILSTCATANGSDARMLVFAAAG